MSKKTVKIGAQHRSFEICREDVKKEDRTISLSFSSETMVERWWGNEVLDHKKQSVRLDRIKNGGPILVDHDRTDKVGVVESVEIDEKNKKGRAVVRFGKSSRADEIFNDIVDEIRKNVSVSYRVHKMILEKEEDGVATYLATDWEPGIFLNTHDDPVSISKILVVSFVKMVGFYELKRKTKFVFVSFYSPYNYFTVAGHTSYKHLLRVNP